MDKRQRNRCQYCRYQKCLATGMKREGKGLSVCPMGEEGRGQGNTWGNHQLSISERLDCSVSPLEGDI